MYGAGSAGKMIVDEIKRNVVYSQIRPVGFFDDDILKQGRLLSGVNILGDWNKLLNLLQSDYLPFQELWISSKKINVERIKKLKELLPHEILVKQVHFEIQAT
jgi:FlaA1/EpsC-like NDP-sugar epimerase